MRIFKKIMKWIGIIIILIIVIPIAIMLGSDQLNKFNANSDIEAVFNELGIGMSTKEARSIVDKTNTYISGWREGDDGTIPKLKGKNIKDTYCVYTAKEQHTFNDGSINYYAMNNTNLIAYTVSGKTCYDDYMVIKSLYLMTSDGTIIKEKVFSYEKNKDFEKLSKSISKAKKEKKPIIMVLFHPSPIRFNKTLRKSLQSKQIADIINKQFIYVEFTKSIDFSASPIGRIRGLPITIFLDSDGKEYKRIVGTFDIGDKTYKKFLSIMNELVKHNK